MRKAPLIACTNFLPIDDVDNAIVEIFFQFANIKRIRIITSPHFWKFDIFQIFLSVLQYVTMKCTREFYLN
jgi:hypothetical protein